MKVFLPMAQRKSESRRVRTRGPGRPPVESKKVRFQVMLDPEYLEHFKNVAAEKRVNVQDLARWAFTALVPDPRNPITGPAELIPARPTRKKGQP
jgi:hypothetical protein